MLRAPLGLHYPQVPRVRPSGVYPSCVYFRAMHSTHHAFYLVPVRGTSSSLMSAACVLKGGGYLSIATQGSYRLSSPHPLALSTASCPGKAATAETRSRAGTRGCRVSTSNPACALKGGCLSITTQGSYRLSGPHPLVCPRHRALGYQRRMRPAQEPGPEDIEHRHLAKFAGTHSKIRPRARRNPP